MAPTARAGAAVAPRPRAARRPRSRVAAPQAVRARGESLLDALLQGRAWIGLVALLLVGIVFFNVDLLRLNRSIAVTGEQAGAVARENARLRLELSRLGSSERVQRAALQSGLALPAPGDVRFRRAGERDGVRAGANVRPPGERAGSSAPGVQGAQAPSARAPQPATPTAPRTPTQQDATPPAAAPQSPTPTTAPPQTATPQVTAPAAPGAG